MLCVTVCKDRSNKRQIFNYKALCPQAKASLLSTTASAVDARVQSSWQHSKTDLSCSSASGKGEGGARGLVGGYCQALLGCRQHLGCRCKQALQLLLLLLLLCTPCIMHVCGHTGDPKKMKTIPFAVTCPSVIHVSGSQMICSTLQVETYANVRVHACFM